ncbi:MAG: trypsin-like peptidase domain-containing protein [Planctomycetota bacterium]
MTPSLGHWNALLATLILPALVAAQQPVENVETSGNPIFEGAAPSDVAELRLMEEHLRGLVAEVMPSVVSVGSASGVIVEGGLILTAGHVITAVGDSIDVRTPDGEKIEVEALGLHSGTDTGILRIVSEGQYPARSLGETENLERGQWCIMLGHPTGPLPGRQAPVRIGRVLEIPGNDYLVTDCLMQAGDSGGPLFDMQGRVIGINSNIRRDLATNRHVPIAAYRRDWDRLIAGERLGRQRNGSGRRGVALGMRFDRRGLERNIVREVFEGSPAADAGVQSGDRVVKIDGDQFRNGRQLFRELRDASGSTIVLGLEREEQPIELSIEVPEREAGPRPNAPGVGRREPLRSEAEILTAFIPVVDAANESVIEIQSNGDVIALGTVVRADGLVVTKASELENEDFVCVRGEREFEAELLGESRDLDLAVLRLTDCDLPAVVWRSEELVAGSLLASADGEGSPLAFGIASSPVYERDDHFGRLGVRLDPSQGGVLIEEVERNTAADRAGLESGDRIVTIDGDEVGDLDDFRSVILSSSAGRKLEFEVLREEERLAISAVLGEGALRPRSSQADLWGPLSVRYRGFGLVLQHDTIVPPEMCGGPVVDLDGQVVAINIARSGRVETLALPAGVVEDAVDEVLNPSEDR